MKAPNPRPETEPLIRPEDILFKDRPPVVRSIPVAKGKILSTIVAVMVLGGSFLITFSLVKWWGGHGSSPRAIEVLPKTKTGANSSFSASSVTPSPPAVPSNGGTVVTIKADDTLWSLIFDHYGRYSPELLKAVVAANPSLAKGKGDDLSIGDRVVLPPVPAP